MHHCSYDNPCDLCRKRSEYAERGRCYDVEQLGGCTDSDCEICAHATCPGWAHFNESRLTDGRIICDIERCDDCGKLEDDDAALAAHDTACTLCRPATQADLDARMVGEARPYGALHYCRVSKEPVKGWLNP